MVLQNLSSDAQQVAIPYQSLHKTVDSVNTKTEQDGQLKLSVLHAEYHLYAAMRKAKKALLQVHSKNIALFVVSDRRIANGIWSRANYVLRSFAGRTRHLEEPANTAPTSSPPVLINQKGCTVKAHPF